LAKEVLFEKARVKLAKVPDKVQVSQADSQEKEPKATTLFEKLRQLRLSIAREEDIPAYHIFSDATLREMEKERPMTDEEFMQISGVGRKKMQDYGYQFIKEIIAFNKKKRSGKKTKKSNTYKETHQLFQEGLSVEEIAQKRGLASTTIYSHLAKLYSDGEIADLKKLIAKKDLQAIEQAKKELDHPDTLKAYYEHFQETIDYGTIRLALAVLEKE
jgi:ATP-dependent DNA helicase RecQ